MSDDDDVLFVGASGPSRNRARILRPKPLPKHIDITGDESAPAKREHSAPVLPSGKRLQETLANQLRYKQSGGAQDEPICISSDSEPEVILLPVKRTPPANERRLSKRRRIETLEDEEDEYETYFDIRQKSIFGPLPGLADDPTPSVNIEDISASLEIDDGFEHIEIAEGPSVFANFDWSTALNETGLPWVPPRKPRLHMRLLANRTSLDRRSRSQLHRRHFLPITFPLDTLRLLHKTKPGDGSTMGIIQMGSLVVVGSATCGGDPDSDDEQTNRAEEPGPYNTQGNLVALTRGHCEACGALGCSCTGMPKEHVAQRHLSIVQGGGPLVEEGHVRLKKFKKRGFVDEVQRPKYFSVTGLAADPAKPGRFVSSGNDHIVCIWESRTGVAPPRQLRRLRVEAVPLDVHYQPRSSRLAITLNNGKIYVYKDSGMSPDPSIFNLIPSGKKHHAAGSMVWGCGPTAGWIFASSEPDFPEEESRGWHRAFKVAGGSSKLLFKEEERGDAMAINTKGDRLAIVTYDKNNIHILRVVDVSDIRGQLPKQQTRLTTPIRRERGIKEETPGEVNMLVFSPDGCLLAVARSDDVIEIYNTHDIALGALYTFEHPRKPVPSDQHYGIVKAVWVGGLSGPLYLLTGGADGCIRLWDLTKDPRVGENGRVIASVPYDIAYFSLGDICKDELPLVVGDLGGTIYMFGRA